MIFDAQGRLLLLRRHAEDLGGGRWATPGGKIEPDEKPLAAAVREIKEESGLDIDPVYLGRHELRMPHGTVHIQTFKAHVYPDSEVIIDAFEHSAYRWFELHNLLTVEQLIWGLPTTLADFGLIDIFDSDPTLHDGSKAILLELGQ